MNNPQYLLVLRNFFVPFSIMPGTGVEISVGVKEIGVIIDSKKAK